MAAYLLKRILLIIPTMLGVLTLTFDTGTLRLSSMYNELSGDE